jgi:hypothetical protein
MAKQLDRPVITLTEADFKTLNKCLREWLETVQPKLSTKDNIHLSAGSLAAIHSTLDDWLDKFCAKTLPIQDNVHH